MTFDQAFDDLTVDGKPLAGFALWRLVAEIAVNEPEARLMIWRCDCDAGVCDRDTGDRPIFNRVWSRCPYTFLRSPQWAVVLWFDNVVELPSSGGFPLTLAAWIVEALLALRGERRARAARRRNAAKIGGS